MKKLLYILAIGILMFACNDGNAQDRKDTDYDKVVKQGNSAWFIIGGAADTTGILDSVLTKTVLIETNDEVICDVYIDSDSLGGTSSPLNSHYFIMQYKEFPDDSYTNLDTVTYQGTVDTTFKMSSSTAYKARYWRILEKGKTDSFSTELQKAYFKFWK
ncbi:MAG: hypothetical protein GY841_20245 [FCB group bacterium]|nr:hypothetical protein [FCB group bacterium]